MSRKRRKKPKITVNNFATALKWKTAHQAVKNSLGDRFDITMAKTRATITALRDLHKISIIDAVLQLEKHAEDNAMKAIIFAAGYELYLEK